MIEKAFTIEDQEAFAALCGDFNPIHVDPLIARRTLFGRPVVHGVHLLIWALDQTLDRAASIENLTVLFKHPVGVGEKVSCELASQDPKSRQIYLSVNQREIAKIAITLAAPRSGIQVQAGRPPHSESRATIADELSAAKGTLDIILDMASFRAIAPSLASLLPHDQIAVLLATSRLVGMECPGYHSVYSQLKFRKDALKSSRTPQLKWSVNGFDRRFSRVDIAATAPGVELFIGAFLRPQPHEQPSFSSIKEKVQPTAYCGRRALVVGGSRGLGALCAKLLGAGGADVRLTYHTGAEDAQQVAREIVDGGGKAEAIQFDVHGDALTLSQAFGMGWQPTHLYYLATPPIFVGSGHFSSDLFARFCDFYVVGFVHLVESIRAKMTGPLSVFYPSSIAVSSPPRDMAEYAAAKAAGESVCRHLASIDRGVSIRVERLPRLPTDQTVSLFPAETTDPVSLFLEILSTC